MTQPTSIPTIEIVVASDGTVHIETKGFQGAGCRAASQFVEQALGRSLSEQLSAEFFAASSTQQQVKEGH